MVGAQDLFLASRIVGGTAGVLDEGMTAGAAAVTLLTFLGVSMADGAVAIAMVATGGLRHRIVCHAFYCIPTTSIEPLPSSERLGRYRWVVERTQAWLNRFRRLVIRYERRSDIHEAFLHLAAALICLTSLLPRL